MGELNKKFTSKVLEDTFNKNYEGYNTGYGLLEQILSESKKQTELLEKIYNLLKPPIILEGSIPEDKREVILKALEGLDENKEEHLE